MKRRVLVTDYVWPSLDTERAILREVDADLIASPTGSESDLARLARDCDAILSCFARVTARVIDATTKCQIIARYGIGVDNIDVAAATRRGIVVTNVPAYCLDEVSDHTLALLLACARKIVFYDRQVRHGNWAQKAGIPIFRLRGRALGIVGFGKIGRIVAEKARAFGLRVLVHDPFLPPEAIRAEGAEPMSLAELLAGSDFVSIHVPLTPATAGFVNAQTLRQMKQTAFLVNTSRGGLVDVDSLLTALKEGWIAGAALDVMPQEPPVPEHPLFALDNVIVTPHCAFYSEESLVELQTKATQEVARVLSGRRPVNVVNPEALGPS